MKKQKTTAPHGNLFSILNKVFFGFRRYLVLLAVAGTVSAMIDGFTIAAIIPLVTLLLGPSAGATGTITAIFVDAFAFLHVPFQFRYLIILVALLLLLRMATQGFFVFVRARVNSRFFSKEVRRLHALTLSASWPFIVRQKAGHLQSSILWDVRRVNDLLDTLVQVVQSGSGLIIYSVVAFAISPITMAVTVVAGLILIVLLRPLMARTRMFSEQMRFSENELTQRIGEHLSGFKLLKASDATDGAIEMVGGDITQLEHALSRSIIASSLGSMFVQPFGFLFAMVLFSVAYFTHTFQIAEFAATLYLIQKIFTYMESTQSSSNVMLRSVPFAEHILTYTDELTESAEVVSRAGKSFLFKKEIAFNDVSFSYTKDRTTLSHVSFEIPSGAFIGLVGPSGAGKTSIIDLLLRLFTPTEGNITVDGVPSQDISLSSWRQSIGYVPQDAFLFHASVRDNIRFYDDSVTDEEIEAATRTASIYEDIMRLPEGFDTIVGEKGATLSGGQRQRISLARALARKPDILVLDEATSALDSETAERIHKVIDQLHGKLTLIVIAHRISSIMAADKVLVLEEGKVIEEGAPREMAENPDSYLARVLRMQGSQE